MEIDIFEKNEKKVLELDIRKKIFQLVKKHAGCHYRDLERKSKLATGTIRYHLNYLVKSGLIKELKDSNNIRYFPKSISSEHKELLSLLRQKSIRNILLLLLSLKNINHEKIVENVNLSPSTVSWHLKKLEKSNIIKPKKEGRKTYYNLLIDKQEIITLLITYQESFLDTLVDNVVEMWEMK